MAAMLDRKTPRPTASASGGPCAITYNRGLATPAVAASRATVECVPGLSPSGSSRAPSIPSTARSATQYVLRPKSRPAKAKTEASR